MNTSIPVACQHCKRPIGGQVFYIGVWPYHYECTQGPGGSILNYAEMKPNPVSCRPVEPLTEDRVRAIIREELQRLNLPVRES